MEQCCLKENLLSEYLVEDGQYKNYNKLMAEYISISEKLRAEISQEENPFIMLDKSLLCISLMTGDIKFYNQNKSNLIDIIQNWNYNK